jgi:hypothetical protein
VILPFFRAEIPFLELDYVCETWSLIDVFKELLERLLITLDFSFNLLPFLASADM